MSAPSNIQSPFRQRVRRRQCEANLDLFEPVTFRKGVLVKSEIERTHQAIAACKSCYFLTECRDELEAVLDGSARRGLPPEAVVQAGVLLDDNGRPYLYPGPGGAKTTKRKGRSKSSCKSNTQVSPTKARSKRTAKGSTKAQGFVGQMDLGLDLGVQLPVNGAPMASLHTTQPWAANLGPVPVRINDQGVELALSDSALELTITRHRLGLFDDFEVRDHEVLERHDELETIRRGLARGMSLRRIAGNLRCGWHRAERLCMEMGIEPPRAKPKPRTRAAA